ncbi:MAG: low molecular weight phosphotyrosine protein phosphatase [Phycisphaeraceae bacterium]|nr:low molecular weight phosphotyrosine protein phosphatase [Phycisphaeraceae bacterium]
MPTNADQFDHLHRAAAGATSVLFVCLGNICRSPLAEGVLKHRALERGVSSHLRIESRGTGDWHVGQPPDPRARAVARKHGIELTSHSALLTPHDLMTFDLVLGMDERNLRHIKRLGDPRGTLGLFRAFDPASLAGPEPGNFEVPDPYHDGPEAFDEVFAMVDAAARALLERIFVDTPHRP